MSTKKKDDKFYAVYDEGNGEFISGMLTRSELDEFLARESCKDYINSLSIKEIQNSNLEIRVTVHVV